MPWTATAATNNVFHSFNKIIENTKAELGKMHIRSIQPQFNLRIQTELEDLTHLIRFSKQALINCGATDSFIDQELVDHMGLLITELPTPIPVYQLDGEKTSTRDITGYINMVMKICDHKESIQFYVPKLGKMDIFLGYMWLRKHNPEIDWVTKWVSLT